MSADQILSLSSVALKSIAFTFRALVVILLYELIDSLIFFFSILAILVVITVLLPLYTIRRVLLFFCPSPLRKTIPPLTN